MIDLDSTDKVSNERFLSLFFTRDLSASADGYSAPSNHDGDGALRSQPGVLLLFFHKSSFLSL